MCGRFPLALQAFVLNCQSEVTRNLIRQHGIDLPVGRIQDGDRLPFDQDTCPGQFCGQFAVLQLKADRLLRTKAAAENSHEGSWRHLAAAAQTSGIDDTSGEWLGRWFAQKFELRVKHRIAAGR